MGHAAYDQRRNSAEVEAAFSAVPAEQVAEIVDGELYVQSRPRPRHARASTRLSMDLSGVDKGGTDSGGWLILAEPELHLGPRPDKLVPDLAGWRQKVA